MSNNIFHAVLGSGSCGNSYVLYDGASSIIVDQGFSFVKFKKKFLALGIPIESIKAIFLTHFHPDHSNGIRVSSNKLNVPIYISKEAIEKEPVVFKRLNLPLNRLNEFEIGSCIKIHDFKINSFKSLHDSGGSVGYYIENKEDKITLISDTGETTKEMEDYAKKSNILFLESNYDENMLLNGPYPYKLKKRVSGKWGHLSNKQALSFLNDSSFCGDYLYLIHLSDKNNDVELVKKLHTNNKNISNIITCPRGSFINILGEGEA